MVTRRRTRTRPSFWEMMMMMKRQLLLFAVVVVVVVVEKGKIMFLSSSWNCKALETINFIFTIMF